MSPSACGDVVSASKTARVKLNAALSGARLDQYCVMQAKTPRRCCSRPCVVCPGQPSLTRALRVALAVADLEGADVLGTNHRAGSVPPAGFVRLLGSRAEHPPQVIPYFGSTTAGNHIIKGFPGSGLLVCHVQEGSLGEIQTQRWRCRSGVAGSSASVEPQQCPRIPQQYPKWQQVYKFCHLCRYSLWAVSLLTSSTSRHVKSTTV